MEETKDNAAPAQGAAQPEATGTTPAKSAAETKLEGQLKELKTKSEGYKKERDTARGERDKAVQERDDLRTENAQLKVQVASHVAGTVLSTEPAATEEPTEEDKIRDVLQRNGLKKCWMLDAGPCFSEAHAREYAGDAFDSLTVISVEEDAPTH